MRKVRGETYYDRLVKEHRRSPYVEESYFALGEHHFENNNWKQAKRYFLRIVRKKRKSKFHHFSIYKLAWCEFNLGRGARAIKYLERVLVIRSEDQNDLRRTKFDHIHLTSEATKDLVVFYSKVKNYRSARRYFESVLKENDVNKNLERLAYVYVENGDQKAGPLCI